MEAVDPNSYGSVGEGGKRAWDGLSCREDTSSPNYFRYLERPVLRIYGLHSRMTRNRPWNHWVGYRRELAGEMGGKIDRPADWVGSNGTQSLELEDVILLILGILLALWLLHL